MLAVDIPEVLAELAEAFESYERALTSNDIEAVNRFFWESPSTIRYGTRKDEHHTGWSAIAEFRRRRGAVNQTRDLRNRKITTFGREFGIANTEYIAAGSDNVGRQSQTWVRTDQGWKIVSAHVSFGL